jgi:hypothetical protein
MTVQNTVYVLWRSSAFNVVKLFLKHPVFYSNPSWANLPNGNCNWSSKLSVQKTRTLVLEWAGGEWRRAPVCFRPDPLLPADDGPGGLSRSKDKVRGFSVPRPPWPVLSEILRSNQPEQKTNDKLLTICKFAVLSIQSYKFAISFRSPPS